MQQDNYKPYRFIAILKLITHCCIYYSITLLMFYLYHIKALSKNGVVVAQQAPCIAVKVLILQASQRLLKILPWQTKSILIIIFSFLKMPKSAVFWHVLRAYIFQFYHPCCTTLFAKWGKSQQFTALIRSLSVVRQGVQNYSGFWGRGCILGLGVCIF